MEKSIQNRDEKKKFSYSKFIKLIQKTKPKYSFLVLGMIFLMLASAIQVYVPTQAATLVNSFMNDFDYNLLIKVIILFIISSIFSALGSTILGIFGENIIKNMREKLWDRLVILKISYFDTVKAGEITSRISNDTTQVKQLLAVTFPQAVASIITLIGTVYMMVLMDAKLSIAMIITVPLLGLIFFPMMRIGSKIGHMRQDELSKFNGITTEILSQIRLVKISTAERQAENFANNAVDSLYRIGKKEATIDGIMRPLISLLFMFTIFGLLAFGIHRISIGEMQMGVLMSFAMYLFNLMGVVPTIGMFFTDIAKSAGATYRVDELLNEEPEDFKDGKNIDIQNKKLKVEDVDFSYDEDDMILKDISFEANPGEVIAFVGPSGGGKTTIFNLLERFYEVDSGEIKFDDISISDIKLNDYRRQIGYVSQESAIMSGTIRENLIFGLSGEYSDEVLWEILELAYAKKFVEEMPDKLDTEVGERGVKLSGGQRQRISIARAFLRDPKLLMLDEATASLDSESEEMVQLALEKLMKGRTTLVIAHRLSTIIDSNKIYFVENGRITGSGKHEDLINKHDTYKRYVDQQFNN